jgi:hypothetical protein
MARTLVAAVVAFVTLSLDGADGVLAEEPPTNGIIAYASSGTLFAIDPDGSNRRVIRAGASIFENAGVAKEVAWVPGTDLLMFTWTPTGGGPTELHTIRADGSNEVVWVSEGTDTRITGFTYLRASPDGKSVVSYMDGCAPDCAFTDGLAIMDISELVGPDLDLPMEFIWRTPTLFGSDPPIRLSEFQRQFAPAWHPAGDSFAVSVPECNDNDVIITPYGPTGPIWAAPRVKLEYSNEGPFATHGTPEDDCNKISDQGLQTWGIEASRPVPILTQGQFPELATREIRGMDWSPDGTKLAFNLIDPLDTTEDPVGSSTLWVINSDGTGLQQLTEKHVAGFGPSAPVWAPDGTEILFAGAHSVGFYAIKPDGTGLRTVRNDQEANWMDWGCVGTTCTAPPDSDDDAWPDSRDNCPTVFNLLQTDADNDGIGDACEGADGDLDGVPDVSDNCPTVSNASQTDTDGDDAGDACDADDDNDGIGDGGDQCQLVAEDLDGVDDQDGCPEGDTDSDADGVSDGLDNGPLTANPSQANNDGDALGNACDGDDDNDGVADTSDQCVFEAEDADGNQDDDGCPEDNTGDTAVAAFRVPSARVGSAPQAITLKIKNAGTEPATAYYEVSGTATYTGCTGVTSVISPRRSVSVSGCFVTYDTRGTQSHTVEIYFGSTGPDDPDQFADNNLENNVATTTSRAR